jgi:hypothetical protein
MFLCFSDAEKRVSDGKQTQMASVVIPITRCLHQLLVSGKPETEQVAMATPCGKQERLIESLSFVSNASTPCFEGKVALITE